MGFPTILLFTVFNILNYLDRYVVASILPLLKSDLQLSGAEEGLLFSAFVPGYVIFSPIFGYLGDRFSRPKLMALGVLLWSLATLGSALSHSYELFLFCRVLIGVGEASFSTIAPGYLKDRINDPVKVNSALSLFYAAIPIGTALGYVSGGVIASRYDWHTALMVVGLPGVVLAFVLLRFQEVGGRALPMHSARGGFAEIIKIPILWYIVGGYILNAFALNGLAPFVPDYGHAVLGFDLETINLLTGVVILATAGSAGTFLGGRLASYFASRAQGEGEVERVLLKFIGVTAVIGAPFVLIAFLVTTQTAFICILFFGVLFTFAGIAPVNSLIVLSCPGSLVTLTQGTSIFLLNVLGTLPAPVIVGKVKDGYSLRWALAALSLPLLLSGLVWLKGRSTVTIKELKL